MALPKTPGSRKKKALIETLPELLVSALAGRRDFILCFDRDDDTARKKVHVMTGLFITPCMLRKLEGQAASQKDEGATMLSRPWK